MKLRPSVDWPTFLSIALLTAAAVALHGYHEGTDDGAVYLPAVLRFNHPGLFPYGAEFFMAHARSSLFAAAAGLSARLTHIGENWAIFLWHIASIFVYLLAGWHFASLCFQSQRARWAALLTLTVTLTVPVAGTALVMMDPYLTARSISTPLVLLAFSASLAGHKRKTALWIVLALAVHPLMGACGAAGLLCLWLTQRELAQEPAAARTKAVLLKAVLPGGFSLTAATYPYSRALDMRVFLFPLKWHWYEWMGVAVPLLFLLWCGSAELQTTTVAFVRASRAMVVLGLASTAAGLAVSSTVRLESFVRLQPMRCFQLISIVFFLFLGGLLGEYILEKKVWRWVLVFAAGSTVVFWNQCREYPSSPHVEWPSSVPQNPWLAAFQWIRSNTPEDAVFAVDPDYIRLPGEDQHGFRALAQRSVLSDAYKDSGVVSLVPELAPEWEQEQEALAGWKHFQLADFERLGRIYPVSWVLLDDTTPPAGLDCLYRNGPISVCRIPGAVGLSRRIVAQSGSLGAGPADWNR